MPLYEYECSDCDARFETRLDAGRVGEEVVVCPECGSIETTRVFSFSCNVSSSSCGPSPSGKIR